MKAETKATRKRAPGGGRKPLPPGQARQMLARMVAPGTLATLKAKAALAGVSEGRAVDRAVEAWVP